MKVHIIFLSAGIIFAFFVFLIATSVYKEQTKPVIESKRTEMKQVPADVQAKAHTASPPAELRVPILMYHYIRDYTNQDDQLGIGLSVSPSTFQNQLTLLKNSGYQSITLNQFASGSYPNKSVVITFDDGYEDHYTDAWPILKNAGMIGTFFVVKNFTGKSGYLTQDQIREMRVGGMEIGGHSTSHKNLMNLSYEAAAKDIAQSLVGTDNVFCYPSGKYSPTTLEVVRDLKIRATVTTNYGIATDKSSLVELPRIRVKNGTDLLTVIAEETAKAKLAASTSQNTSN